MTRIAVIQKEKCNPEKCGNYLCIKLCPVNRTGSECIVPDPDDKKARIDEALCTGCGICPNRCPFDAISIINLPEELNKPPIHRFGQNGFHLYNLPVPQFGKVVGILGRNGIGKSTALQILAGLLKPNLGSDEYAATDQDLIEYFKGTIAQSFFERLAKGDIKVSYKPQQVDMIPKVQKGTIREILVRVDEKGIFDKVVEELSLKNFLDRDIKNVSGGELQRVAIAAASMRKANVYFFDEPTSYLDIRERIRVSRFIRSLADEDTAVMLIEHDLIILDYMTDLVHLMYGKPAVYGIVSQPKTTKLGINVYLHGYLKEENIRFRDKPLQFMQKQAIDLSAKEQLISWQGIKKKFGDFSLQAPAGKLKRSEVAGILGPNGIGKTSFVKVLAGVEKADEGNIDVEVTVSYKPQYLETDSEELVMVVLQDALQKYDTLLISPLEIKPLLDKRLCDLSGGELQRVSIAACLTKKADLYLLDEPSAYLDVEQRLVASRTIRGFMEHKGRAALVVDHDLLFVDYLSDSLMVFEGKPAISGLAEGPFSMVEGMNRFLRSLDMTLRRDPENLRPRVNKVGSQLDQKQKKEGKLYYH